MDPMEKYKIQESIRDAIVILDSAPIQRDLVPERNIVQLTNRAPIAHLAIERGIKALINDAGGDAEHTHGLQKLYRDLSNYNVDAFDYLDSVFSDAVSFFGYNVNVKGYGQLRSLKIYLESVGTDKAFKVLRYWVLGESSNDQESVPNIFLSIHRELLCALGLIFSSRSWKTVSGRVETIVTHAMSDGRRLAYNSDDTSRKKVIDCYWNWLFRDHTTRRDALRTAVEQDFAVIDDEVIRGMLCDGYRELRESEDPAVRYFARSLSYLPLDSQERTPGVSPEMQWFSNDQVAGVVLSPGGTGLGDVERGGDGGWSITPYAEGVVRAAEVARSLRDAKRYLVNRMTREASCVINGRRKQLRICVTHEGFLPANLPDRVWSDTDGDEDVATYELDLWDANHGFQPGDQVAIGVVWDEVDTAASVLYGTVGDVENQQVSIIGSDVWTLRRSLEEWLIRTTQD